MNTVMDGKGKKITIKSISRESLKSDGSTPTSADTLKHVEDFETIKTPNGYQTNGKNDPMIKNILKPATSLSNLKKKISVEEFPSEPTAFIQTGFDSLRRGRAQEKKDMQELNEKFANYIEKTRFLEAQNKNLMKEIESINTQRVTDHTKLKQIYEEEINKLRNLIEDKDKCKTLVEIELSSRTNDLKELQRRVKHLDERNYDYKTQLESQEMENCQLEKELIELRAYKNSKEKHLSREQDEIRFVKEEMKKLRQSLDHESLARMIADRELQSCKEVLQFERQANEEEIRNLTSLIQFDKTKENKAFWRMEMGKALHDIQIEYDNKLTSIKQDLEEFYETRLQEIRTSKLKDNMEISRYREENFKTKSQLKDLKHRLYEIERQNAEYENGIQNIRLESEESQRALERKITSLTDQLARSENQLKITLSEFQSMADMKMGLEMEISAYSKLLELETDRGNNGDSSFNLQFINVFDKKEIIGESKLKDPKESSPKKTKSRKTTKGNISITNCDINGSFVVLKNIGLKLEILDGMKIKRNIDGNPEAFVYIIPPDTSLTVGETIYICSKGTKQGRSEMELEIEEMSWGTGQNVETILVDVDGKERAVHFQEVSNLNLTNY